MSDTPKPAPEAPREAAPLPELDGVGITPQPEPEPDAGPKSEILGDDDESAPAPEAPLPDLPIVVTHENSPPLPDHGITVLFWRVYGLIAAALLLSAVVCALTPVAMPEPERILDRQLGVQLLFAFEIACVAFLTRYVPRLPVKVIACVLAFFAVINGVSFKVFLLWISREALAYAFLMMALGFTASAAIAYWMDLDLTSLGGVFLLFGCGPTIIGLVAYFSDIDGMFTGTAIAGSVLFAGLSTFFMEDISDLESEFDDDPTRWKAALCGALILYLNFVNLYLVTMRLIALAANRVTDDEVAMARRRLRSW